jgi:gmma-aminobutyric acid receptor subunit gamma/cGMP-dependent protein kinase 2
MHFSDDLTYCSETVSHLRLPDVLNNFFVSVGEGLPALDLFKLDELRKSLGPTVPDKYIVSPKEVFCALCKVSLNKSPGPDLIPHKIIKNMSFLLCEPICAIINSSIRQGIVPEYWKIARITPLPKQFPPSTVENDIRPIAITNSIAKIAEKFVARWFNEYFESHLDTNQFGCTSDRSTTHALIKLTHEIFQASDNSNNFVRILFIDFSKAFDKIDHNILLQKFMDYNFPPHISAWSLSFLHDRKQFVKTGNIQSSILSSNAGTPQGTISGPNDFKLLINDLNFDLNYAKYVDDTTVLSVSRDPNNLDLQQAANKLSNWTNESHMTVNEGKTKEMLIYFGTKHETTNVPLISINEKLIERVHSFKLLGVVLSDTLSWQEHVDYILRKVARIIMCVPVSVIKTLS